MDQLRQLIREAQNGGSLDSTEDPVQLAFELEAYLLVGNSAFVLSNDPTALGLARTTIRNRLGSSDGVAPRSPAA